MSTPVPANGTPKNPFPGAKSVAVPPSTSSTLAKERENVPFSVHDLSVSMHGSERALSMKKKFMQEFSRDPAWRSDDVHDLSKDQIRERTMLKFHSMVHYVTTESITTFNTRMTLVSYIDPAFWTRLGVHYGLFLGALRSGASPNQFAYWMSKGVLGLQGVIGCFGMTELGHGSNVAGLETTATLDMHTDEFIIHTPTITATKWWIGGAASTATHCAVFAQLYVKGKCHGVKTFIVQLRDTKSFELMPGVSIGDLGKKMGRDGIDNGHISFTYVRIPRGHMLMKHSQVDRQGNVYEPPLAQLTYGALLSGRTAMVADSSNTAKKALTIAIRYAAVRRQFKSKGNELETCLIDYPIHQRRLMPLLAQAVTLGYTGLAMTRMYEKLSEALESLEPGDSQLQDVLSKLKETHITSSGLKAFCTWSCLETIDKARQTLGGHGYSAYSGFSSLYADFAVQCTWEGDNTVLALQAGRGLIGAYFDAKAGKKLAPGVAYLADLKSYSDKCQQWEKVCDLDVLQRAWNCVSANALQKAATDFQTLIKAGKNKEQAFEMCSQIRFVAAKVHSTGYIVRTFASVIKACDDERIRAVLVLNYQLYALWQIEEQAVHFLRYGFFSPSQIDQVNARVNELCLDLRKIAIPLVDSFEISDHVLNSPLGRYDGAIYEAYFDQIKRSNPQLSTHPYFDRLIKPLLERKTQGDDDLDTGVDEDIQAAISEREETKK